MHLTAGRFLSTELHNIPLSRLLRKWKPNSFLRGGTLKPSWEKGMSGMSCGMGVMDPLESSRGGMDNETPELNWASSNRGVFLDFLDFQ